MRKDEFIKKVNSYLCCNNNKESIDYAIKIVSVPKKKAQRIAIVEHLERLDKYERKK